MLKKDKISLGLLIGILLPAAFYGILKLVNLGLIEIRNENFQIKEHTIILLSIFINIVPIRYYFVNLKFDRTGRGILMVTFILMVLFFVIIKPVGS